MDSGGGVSQHLPDGVTSAALHNQFIGNFQSLTELPRLLKAREDELVDKIEQQNVSKHAT